MPSLSDLIEAWICVWMMWKAGVPMNDTYLHYQYAGYLANHNRWLKSHA